MTGPPPPQPRAGIGEWPVWGDEPPELWFGQVPFARRQPPAAPPAWPAPAAPARPASSGMAFAGFLLGLFGACLAWIPLAGLAGALFGAVLSVHARRGIAPGHQGRGLATAGLVLGCIGIVFGVTATAILATIALNALLGAAYNG